MKNKYAIHIITLTLLLSSCQTAFIPCVDESADPESIQSKLMPVKTGNKWIYDVNLFEKKAIVSTDKKTLEIGKIDSVYYMDDDYNKHYVPIYRIIDNGHPNTMYGYIKCSDGVIFAKEFGYSPRELEEGRTLPDNVVPDWEDPRCSKVRWWGPVKVTVPAGTFECWACDYTDRFDQKVLRCEYYSVGVGLVKVEYMSWKRTVQSNMELTTYTLK